VILQLEHGQRSSGNRQRIVGADPEKECRGATDGDQMIGTIAKVADTAHDRV
jgi:hypothetical protein